MNMGFIKDKKYKTLNHGIATYLGEIESDNILEGYQYLFQVGTEYFLTNENGNVNPNGWRNHNDISQKVLNCPVCNSNNIKVKEVSGTKKK